MADLNLHSLLLVLAKVHIHKLDTHIKGMVMRNLKISTVMMKMKRKKMKMMTRISVVMTAVMNEWKV